MRQTVAQDTINYGNFGYKWTITCFLVVQNTKKGTTLIAAITINVVKTVVKYGVVPRDPRKYALSFSVTNLRLLNKDHFSLQDV